MQSRSGRGESRRVFSTFARLWLAATLPFSLMATAFPVQAAVKYDDRLNDQGSLYLPLGVAADPFGDVYVADTSHHRIIKFDQTGNILVKFGREGSGKGQLYYPRGVTVGTDAFDRKLVFIADTNNSRIVVFTDQGRYVRAFGTNGGGDGQLNYPGGIAFVAGIGVAGYLFVADTRNGRVLKFTLSGHQLAASTCSDCPDGLFGVPLGVGYRRLKSGELEIYVTDEYTGRVHVLDQNLSYLRSFGTKGIDEGQLASPDEIAVDKDGSAFVADSGIGAERISKFREDGAFLFSFSTTGRQAFVQPHGVGLDQDGHLYVVNSSLSKVYKFSFVPPRISASSTFRSEWREQSAAVFKVRYNGVEQLCDVTGTATITAPAGGSSSFTVRGRFPGANSSPRQKLEMPMTATQLALVTSAWDAGKQIGISATFVGRCEDGTVLRPPKENFKL